MLNEPTRTAILKLSEEGHASRAIARALKVSRVTIKKVLTAGGAQPPRIQRPEKADAHLDRIRELHESCGGNLVRVHEELAKAEIAFSYQALTGFCRRHGIGKKPQKVSGEYTFGPGEEMQHDTSPHDVMLGGRKRRVQTASAVLCYSRMIFMQMYPRFTRFYCKLFLTEALKYFGGACERCMIDNTHVVTLRGTGREMVPVPEMEVFSERYGFTFIAHEKGDADRKGRVERPFHFIENNFLAGRSFDDFDHLNREAVAWCEKKNAVYRKHLHGTPRELFAAERPQMRSLPIWIPEPYLLHHRLVSVEGYVKVDGRLYSAPYELVNRQVEVRETKDRIEIYDGPRMVGTHKAVRDDKPMKVTEPSHRPRRGEMTPRRAMPREEEELRRALPEFAEYITELKKRSTGRGTLPFRRLLKMAEEYPKEALNPALKSAMEYGLYDLDRLERLILRNVQRNFFRMPEDKE